jgi:lincosamide nucleotidyltransferase A/C/D/E
MTTPSPRTRVARTLYRFVQQNRLLRIPAGWLSRVVALSPESSPLRHFLGPLRDRLRGAMKTDDVLGVLSALEAHDVPFAVAGGWGVDALLERQTRSHDDLDIAIDDYEHEVERAIDVLRALGFHLVATHERRAWMPKLSILHHDDGHRVELVSLNWQILAREFGPPGADSTRREAFEQRVYSQGLIGGRWVRCLSAEVQLLYHSSFELGPTLERDVVLLRTELGVSLPQPEAT